MPTTWTDYPADSNTPFKAIHLNEVRIAIEGAGGAPPGGWTDGSRVTTATPIRAKHLVELRDAVQTLWTNSGLGSLPPWSSGVVPGGDSMGTAATVMRASDINDVRHWFNRWEARRCGVYSVAYYPRDTSDPNSRDIRITNDGDDAWARDVQESGVWYVRVLINTRPNTDDIEQVLPTYETLCNYYRGRRVLPIGVLTSETLRTGDPKAPLDPVTHSNTYIENFSRRVARIADYLQGVVDHFEVWNEPDNWDQTGCPNLASDHFGSMLYYSAKYTKKNPGLTPNAQLISGGLFYHDELQGGLGWDQAYLEGGQHGACTEVGLYNAAAVTQWRGEYPGTYPWDHLGIHPYNTLTGGKLVPALDATRNVQLARGDPSDIWATEFGERRYCLNDYCNPLDPGSGTQQASDLDGLFALVLGRAYVGLAVWQKHEKFQDPGDNPKDWFGLTEYSSSDSGFDRYYRIASSQHWPSWDRIRTRTGGP